MPFNGPALIFAFLFGVKAVDSKNTSAGSIESFPGCSHDMGFLCFSQKAAKIIERSMNADVRLQDGLTLIRNGEIINFRQEKALDGFTRLRQAILNFIDTHTLSVDLTEKRFMQDKGKTSKSRGRAGKIGGGSEGGGLFNMNSKKMQREKKYYHYVFMVLLGIFGLTGPLAMKILGVMAAKALLASKAALVIVGSVVLNKIFENSKQKSKVQVSTLPLHQIGEDHDRISYTSKYIPTAFKAYVKTNNAPYSAYYTSNIDNHDFDNVLYDAHKVKSSKKR